MTWEFDQVRQLLSPGQLVKLYTLDASALGGPVLYWVPGPLNGAPVSLGGISYTPYPVDASGFEWSGQGSPPRPKLRASNINGYMTSLIIAYGDLRGAQVIRTRTLADFLDGQPDADPTAGWSTDVWYIDQKTHADNTYVEWQLAMVSDQQGIILPRRQCIQNNCTYTYRVWQGDAFNYSAAQCPYTGSALYTTEGLGTEDPTQDVCGRKLTDCRLRFGQGATLPFGGFPGMLRS
jgi:lambda family phage minor tail protein L